ncbi:hypothetical protein ACHAXM_001308 [Skeletonema potamos]
MTSNNDDNNSTLKNQDGRDNLEVGGKQKNIPKIDGVAAAAKAKAKEEGASPRPRRHSSSEAKRRRHNNPLPRFIIPEARVIQAYNECAYISDYEEDERECLPLPIRRSGEVVRYSLQEEIRHHQVEEVKNDSSSTFSKTDVGDRQQRNTRCLCFDCWAGPK